jgi:predicted Na+-dependent transporter
MARGDYAEDLHDLAAGGAGAFLSVAVILPLLLGIAVRFLAGERRVTAAKPFLKLVNTGVVLFLNYSNASATLPQAIARPDPDFLIATLGIVAGLCAAMFASGWAIARWVGADREHGLSLMFGLGMNKNGTGLVMASLALADHPRLLLPIIFYNLVQHLFAGTLDRILDRFPQISGRQRTGQQGSAKRPGTALPRDRAVGIPVGRQCSAKFRVAQGVRPVLPELSTGASTRPLSRGTRTTGRALVSEL